MIGQTLSHFKITAKLGEGGMGEVYRAMDTRLGREVALKVLPAEMASSPERLERFRREAKALAALDHPGIVTVFSVEDADGIHFLTMQLVDGEPLDRLIPEGGLPAERILEIATRFADALAAAHAKGIIHRDLKPANIMVTPEGRVKVLDFGLARMSEAEAEGHSDSELATELLTREGAIMGTVPYMSPEQVSGRPLDHRSDLFSVGVILYEMATGRRPFQGHSSAELASAILRDVPRSIDRYRDDLPEAVSRVIRCCLEKEPEARFATARDLRDGLRGVRDAGASGEVLPTMTSQSLTGASATAEDDGFWIAVLPFRWRGASAELEELAEGMSEDIVTALSRFSYLRVIAHSSTERFSGEPADVRSVGKAIGARYVMEGSLRQAGSRLRVAVRLVDAATGAHLWAENYERTFSPETVFELQDELVPRIVSTVADMNGVLPRSMSTAVRSRDPEQLSPYEAVLRSFGYLETVTSEELAAAHSALELAVREAPASADAWAMLAFLCAQDYGQGYELLPDPLASGATAAQRAVEKGPSNHLAYFSLAQVLFFQKQFQAFCNAAERAASLNPMDGNCIAFLGEMLTYSGDTDRGLAFAERAKQLNPSHPGWYWYTDFYDAYREGDYGRALDFALKANLPDHWGNHAMLSAAYGQLGDRVAAARAVEDLLRVRPDFASSVRKDVEKWWEPEYVEHMIDGWRKAGLQILAASVAGSSSAAADSVLSSGSVAARADEGFWVAVLPFKWRGESDDLEALAEGLSEDIVTGLSRFSYLRVIARGSPQRYADTSSDLRAIGEEIGARYVIEGSLRQAGSTLRIGVQLVDAGTGAHLWAETYDRDFGSEHVFALQDDLVPQIVSTVADWYGVLPHSMSESVRFTPPDQLSSYEAVLRSFGYFEHFGPEEHAAVRAGLERAVETEPGNADAWAMLSMMYGEEHRFGFNVLPDPLGRALRAARRAVEAAHANNIAWLALAQALFFRRDFDAFRDAAERAVVLNSMDGSTLEYLGHLMAFAGDWERGCDVSERARQLNPNHPGWYWSVHFLDAYRQGDYQTARTFLLKTKHRGGTAQLFTKALLAAVHGQLGEQEAEKDLEEMLQLQPDSLRAVRGEFEKWYLPDLVEQLMDGLRKAGLATADEKVPADASSVRHASGEERADEAGNPAAAVPVEASHDTGVAIAVLPFTDMSPARDQEYLCEGMAEEIMNALVQIDGIRVASRTSAFRAQRDGADLSSIARALSVGHILEGSVRAAETRLRVTVQLTDADSGYQVWSERFDREATDVFAIQDEIATGVVDAVKARLAPATRVVPARRQASNLEAYRRYLKGRHLRGIEDHEGARQAFEEAVRLDPSYAPAWTALAEIIVLAVHFSLIPAREGCKAARQALATAAELQGESVEGLHSEAFAAFIERRWADMEATWRRALELQPTHVLSLGALGLTLCTRQRPDEGLPFLERARQVDPLASFPYARTAVGFLISGRPEEALRYAEDGLTFEKEDITAVLASSMSKIALGRREEGIAEAKQTVTLSRRGAFFLGVLGWALAIAGQNEGAGELLKELRARPAGSPTIVSEAWLLGALGQVDEAFEVIDRAEEEYQAMLYYTGFPGFDSLRGDSRFAALLTRLELPPS